MARAGELAVLLRRLLVGAMACIATYHVLLTASTVLSSSLHYPFMDQFRITLRYLTTPFPDNILALENGHRPILPGLIRVLELNAFAGWPVLQTTTAWCSAVAAGALLLWRIHRDLGLASVEGMAAACTVISLLYWNANARMLIHAFEAVHILYIAFFVVLALLLAVSRAAARDKSPWIVAVFLCAAATFTFGPGIASFCAIGALAVLRRRLGIAVAIGMAAVLALVAYGVLLPGSEGVRSDVAGASPKATLTFAVARVGAITAEIARVMQIDLQGQMWVSLVAGALLLMLVCVSLLRRWRRLDSLSPIELVGIGLFVFGCSANALIAVSRTKYFVEYPIQIFADRYLFWSGVTWAGAVIYGVSSLQRAGPVARILSACGVAVLGIAMVPPAIEANIWASIVYGMSELQGVSSKLGLRTDEQLAKLTDDDLAMTYRSLDEMRRRHLNVFANATVLKIGHSVPIAEPAMSVPVKATLMATDEPEHQGATLFSGVLPAGVAAHEREAELWLASPDGGLLGRAALTQPGDASPPYGRLGIADLSGFEGYVQPPVSGEIFLVSEHGPTIRTLARLTPTSNLR